MSNKEDVMQKIDIFPWDEHFNTGIEIIDEQHRKLVDILNNLATLVAYGASLDSLNNILDELTQYTQYHFETEENIWHKYLQKSSFEREHKEVHQEFIDTIEQLRLDQKNKSLFEVASEALGFLARWLASHILESDRFMGYMVLALEDGLDLSSASLRAKEQMSGSTRTLIDIILSIYETLSKNTLQLMQELGQHTFLEESRQETLRSLQRAEHIAKIGNWRLDITTGELKWSDEIFRIFEVDQKEFSPSYEWFLELVHPEDREMVQNSYTNSLTSQQNYSIVHRLLMQDGRIKYILAECESDFDAKGRPLYSIGTMQDITKQKKDEEQLRLAASVFKNTDEGILITSPQNCIIDANEAVEKITGYTKEEMFGQNPKILSSSKQPKSFYKTMWEALETDGFWRGEVWNRRKDGELYAELLTISTVKDENGAVQNYIALFSDITVEKKQQKHLEHIAHYDLLTNLPNRSLLLDRLSQAMAHSRRNKTVIAVAYLDLDGFKEINDKYGHEAGDMLLSTMAKRMRAELREGDTIARIGGDEFVIILPDLHVEDDFKLFAKRLLDTTSKKVKYEESIIQVTASMGIAFFHPQDKIEADQLLRYGDQAMYQAKITGKNQYSIFNSSKAYLLKNHHEKLKEIKSALVNKEFVLYYQPKVDMRQGKVTGVEALIRWQHSEKGLVSPAEFIPLISGDDLSVQVGEWVLHEAIKQLALWKSKGLSLTVSINIDGVHLLSDGFIPYLSKLLKKYPSVKTSDFILEILEVTALKNISEAVNVMQECKKLGIGFSLDDFGTGYSSLTYLKRLPAKEIKIDKSFVRDMLIDPDDMAILDGIVGLAKSFGCDVIAEGVEDIKHGEFLLRSGCDKAQGYVIARPMAAKNLPDWINNYIANPKWMQVKRIDPINFPLLYGQIEYNAYLLKIREYIKDPDMTVEKQNYKDYRFSAWIYGLGKEQHGHNKNFERLEQIHKKFHQKANDIIEQKNYGKEILKCELEHLDTLHQEVVKLAEEFY